MRQLAFASLRCKECKREQPPNEDIKQRQHGSQPALTTNILEPIWHAGCSALGHLLPSCYICAKHMFSIKLLWMC